MSPSQRFHFHTTPAPAVRAEGNGVPHPSAFIPHPSTDLPAPHRFHRTALSDLTPLSALSGSTPSPTKKRSDD